MRLLVISDYFYNLSQRDSIAYLKWSEGKLPPLISLDCVLIDMTFNSEENKISKDKMLYDLMNRFKKPTVINKKGLIVIVVCGSLIEDCECDEPYDKRAPFDNVRTIEFRSYDFLQNILPDYMNSVLFEICSDVFSTAYVPVNLYLDRYSSEPAFLYFDYEPGNKKHADILPLAKIKEDGDPCVSFECRRGKGTAVILTAYKREDAKQAFLLLLKICKNYTKNKEVSKEIRKIDHSIPEPIRSTFIEALVCLSYDLYVPSLILCRKALEESVIYQGATKFTLKQKIEEIFSDEKDSILKTLAEQIKDFGNWVVHPDIYAGKEATEEDVRIIVKCLKNYFNYIHSLPGIVQTTNERKVELTEKEV